MTRIERENLIERYLRGEMSLEEEENFFIEVAANPELRYELKAYQVVERAITGDRASGDRPYTALRARMQKQLAATPPVAARPAAANSSTASSSRKRWAAALIAGTIMIVALVFFTLNSHQESVVKDTLPQPTVGLRDTTTIASTPSPSESAPAQQSAPPGAEALPTPKALEVPAVPTTTARNTTERNAKQSASETATSARQHRTAKRQTITAEGSQQAVSNDSRPAESVDTSTADPADSISIRFELMTPRSSQ